MDKQKELLEALNELQLEQRSLSKAVHQNNTLMHSTMDLDSSIKGYTQQLAQHTEKVEQTLTQASSALKVLQKLTEGEAKFTDTLDQFRNDAQDKSEAFARFVESMMIHKASHARLTERLSKSMETLDDDTKRYLIQRKEQLDKFFKVSLQQFTDFVNTEKKLFQESIDQLKPEGLHKAMAQLDLLTPIHDHLMQLELSEQGASAIGSIGQKLDRIDKNGHSHLQASLKEWENRKQQEVEQKDLSKILVQEIRNLKYIALFGYLVLIVFFYLIATLVK
ncbi:MAG: hypothetical protein AAFX87_18690 [Bacteroidota bacterium]